MDKHTFATSKKRIERTMKALEKANMQAFYADDKAQALEIVKGLIPNGATVAAGGSMTLSETGITDYLKSGCCNYLDRTRAGITPEEIGKVYRAAFSADVYLSGTNAVTESGELVNTDGNSNRVAAISFGPESVIIVVGANKIVKDVTEAAARIKATAAPANVDRLSCNTPCAQTGKCESCRSEGCICCTWTVHRYSRIKNRIKVILVNESLGY